MNPSVSDVLIALGVGFLFGWVLDKGGLNRYYKIANVFRFTDLTVLRFMMSGMVVGMIGIYVLRAAGQLELTAVTATALAGNFIGGAVFGVGMSLAGFCPGTCITGVARGQIDYLIPGIVGFLTGGVIYGSIYRTDLVQWLLNTGRPELAYAKLPELLGLDPLLMAFVFAEAILIFLYVLARTHAHRKDDLEQAVRKERIDAKYEDIVRQSAGD